MPLYLVLTRMHGDDSEWTECRSMNVEYENVAEAAADIFDKVMRQTYGIDYDKVKWDERGEHAVLEFAVVPSSELVFLDVRRIVQAHNQQATVSHEEQTEINQAELAEYRRLKEKYGQYA